MDELELRLQTTANELQDVMKKSEMTSTLFFEVVERTQNFREGFYSQRRIHDLTVTAARTMQTAFQSATLVEEQVVVMENFVTDMKNILATMMTEIDRIDE